MVAHIPRPPGAAPPLIAARSGDFDRLGRQIETHPTNRSSPRQYAVSDARLRQLAKRLHQLGERTLYLVLLEIARGTNAVEAMEGFATLDPRYVAARGLDKLPPLSALPGRRR